MPKNKTCLELFAGCGGVGSGLKLAGYDCSGGIEYYAPAANIYDANHKIPLTRANILDIDRIPTVDILWASPPCFPAGVTVLTNIGLKEISTIQVGDLVLTHKGRYQPVTNVMSRIAPTVRLDGLGHPGLEVTENHPFLAAKIETTYPPHKERCKGNYSHSYLAQPSWVPASEMKGQHWLSIDRFPSFPIPKLVYSPNEKKGQSFNFTDNNFWWLIGCWVGNGWVRYQEGKGEDTRNRGTVYICDGISESAEIEAVLEASGIKFSKSFERTAARFSIHSRPLCRWLLSEFGKYAHGKSLPSWLLGANQEIRSAFLDGYFSADGYKQVNTAYLEDPIRCSTVSRNLAITLRMLGLTLDYSVSVKLQKRTRLKQVIEGRIVNEKPCYSVGFAKTDLHCKRLAYENVTYRSGVVRKINDSQQSTTVYDITVAEDESFIADGIIVHNCPGFSLANKNRGETARDIELAQHVANLMIESRPRSIAIENVQGYWGSQSCNLIMAALENAGYNTKHSVECAANYGAATTRRRLIIRASLDPIKPLVHTHQKPENSDQQSLFDRLPNWISWYDAIESFIHELPQSALTAIQSNAIAQQKPLLADKNKTNILIERLGYRGQPNIYSANVPCPTIRAHTHIDDHGCYRVATNILNGDKCYAADIKTLAAWQSFPNNYNWLNNKGEAGRGIGNSVPVLLSAAVAKSFNHLVY